MFGLVTERKAQRFRFQPFCIVVAVLITFLSASAFSAGGVTVIYGTDPVTMSKDPLLLGGLVFQGPGGEGQLLVTWEEESSPFGFSLWRIVLRADRDLLPDNLGTRIPVRTIGDVAEATLAYISPGEGAIYELALAYDVSSAVLGLALTDSQGGSVLLHDTYTLQPAPTGVGPLPLDLAPSLRALSIIDRYTPVGLTWQIVERTHDAQYVPVSRISVARESFLQLRCAGQGEPAPFVLAYRDGGEWKPWLDLGGCDGDTIRPLPVRSLPRGSIVLTLLYGTGEESIPVGQSRTYHVVEGVVTFSSGQPYWESGQLKGSLTASADDKVAGNLQVWAEVDKYADGDWRSAGTVLLFEERVALSPEPVSLPLHVPGVLPSETLRIRIRPDMELEEEWHIVTDAREYEVPSQVNKWLSLPHVDLAYDRHRRVIVDRSDGGYRGHTDTVLVEGSTILAVYALGHGGATALQRSDDGGKTWSGRLSVPADWAETSDVPTIHKTIGPDGVTRLIVMQTFGPRGISNEQRQAISEDGGRTWTPFKPNGLRSPVSPNTMVRLSDGSYLTVFQLDGRIEQSISTDGGLTWKPQTTIAVYPGARLTEPAVVASPDGKQLAVLIRENTRRFNSMLIVSHDEGKTWTRPVELPAALTGDRHKPVHTPDGRLVVVFRDMAEESPTYGDFVAWVGTFDDLINLREGMYRVRLLENPGPPRDTGYAGLEVLEDGTLVATTYVPLAAGERPSIVSVRFHLDELDRLVGLVK